MKREADITRPPGQPRQPAGGAKPPYQIASDYMVGSPIRQDYLKTVIEWIDDGDVDGYMAAHQHDPNANPLWLHFKKVIDWVETTFPRKRSEMKSGNWGPLYNRFKDADLDSTKLKVQVADLMTDPDVTYPCSRPLQPGVNQRSPLRDGISNAVKWSTGWYRRALPVWL